MVGDMEWWRSQRLLGYQLLFQNAIKRQTNNRDEGFHRGGVFSLHAVTYKMENTAPLRGAR